MLALVSTPNQTCFDYPNVTREAMNQTGRGDVFGESLTSIRRSSQPS
jgi:hypothetical protein